MNYIRHLNLFFAVLKKDQALSASHVSLYLALFQCWNLNRFQNPIIAHRDNIMKLCKIGSKNTYHKCLKELQQASYIYCQPGHNKFQPLKISIINLDKKAGENNVIQLDFFEASKPSTNINNGTGTVPNMIHDTVPNMGHGKVKCDTVPVPNMIPGKVKIGTVPVPNMGHLYKLNIKTINSVCNTPTNFLCKNLLLKKIEKNQIQDAGPVQKKITEKIFLSPDLAEVEIFFRQNNYPAGEAKKFYLYNQGKAWMFSATLKIQDWHSVAHKWMLNVSPFHNPKNKGSSTTHHIHQEKNYGEPL